MTVPGLLIEYLITGAFTLLWVGCLLSASPNPSVSIGSITAAEVTFLVPLAYIVGTFIDFVGRALTRALDPTAGYRGKHGAAKYYVNVKFCFAPPTVREEDVRVVGKEEMFVRAPEAAKQYELRKARDRVARGVFTNFVLMLLIVPPVIGFGFRAPRYLIYVIPLLLASSWLAYGVWKKMVDLSVTFRNDVSIEFKRQEEEALAKLARKDAPTAPKTRNPAVALVAVAFAAAALGALVRSQLK